MYIEDDLYIVNYCHPDCRPLENIMRLPEAEAFQLARQLAQAHPDTTAFYRFADFHNTTPAANKRTRCSTIPSCPSAASPRSSIRCPLFCRAARFWMPGLITAL